MKTEGFSHHIKHYTLQGSRCSCTRNTSFPHHPLSVPLHALSLGQLKSCRWWKWESIVPCKGLNWLSFLSRKFKHAGCTSLMCRIGWQNNCCTVKSQFDFHVSSTNLEMSMLSENELDHWMDNYPPERVNCQSAFHSSKQQNWSRATLTLVCASWNFEYAFAFAWAH